MMGRSGRIAAVMLLLLLGGCSSIARAWDRSFGERFHLDKSFHRLLTEFDSVAARTDPAKEPDRLEYVQAPERLPWYARQLEGLGFDFLVSGVLGARPSPVVQENPSGYARERLVILISMVGDDVERGALVAARLLWVVEKDHNLLNRVVSLRGVETILGGLDLDPMDPLLDNADHSPQRQQEVEAAAAELEKHWPARRKTDRLSAAQRQAFETALASMTRCPLPSALKRRQLLLALATGYAEEPDSRMRASLWNATRRSLLFAAGLGLRDSLAMATPELRDVAIRAYSRLCGPIGVPYVLRRIAAPAGWEADNPYDSDPLVRLTLVRLCAQLKGKSVQGGKMAVDFLYDTAVADDEAGLRQVALEGLALCLQRPQIEDDEEWATTWRQQFIAERSKK
jgi:hypothetical protein